MRLKKFGPAGGGRPKFYYVDPSLNGVPQQDYTTRVNLLTDTGVKL